MDFHSSSLSLCLPEFLSRDSLSFSLFNPNYSVTLMSNDSNQSQPLICPICLNLCSNPCLTNACTHIFCLKCLKMWKKIKNTCPYCRKKFSKIYLF